jgi:rhamnogalacturonyl hydrolase YesR
MLHNSTVDVVDFDPDPLRIGGTPYHTEYHQDAVCVTSHTWTEGMFEYAYVSGDREAFRAAVGICDWILRWMKGKPHLVAQDGREIGWPIIALVAGYRATDDKRYLDACWELVGYYHEKVAKYGELLNNEPPGANYVASLYGEYAGFEGLHKLWLLTGDEALRKFTVECIASAIERGTIDPMNPVSRSCDMYAIYALCDMTKDAKWLDLAKSYLPIVLGRADWDGYMYRRIMQYLKLCHDQGWIEDNQVALKS